MKTQMFLAMAIAAILPNSHGKTLAEGLRENLANTKANPTKENVMSLATEIAGNRKHVRLLDEDARSLTDVAVCELCQIPGHARYFADELERKWEIAKEDPWGVGKRCSYDFERRTYLVQTLPHLPSPETVMVLGSYLEDERDAPPTGYQPSDCNPIPQNSVLAAWGMSLLGVRGFLE